jgi:hypothetical protein
MQATPALKQPGPLTLRLHPTAVTLSDSDPLPENIV